MDTFADEKLGPGTITALYAEKIELRATNKMMFKVDLCATTNLRSVPCLQAVIFRHRITSLLASKQWHMSFC